MWPGLQSHAWLVYTVHVGAAEAKVLSAPLQAQICAIYGVLHYQAAAQIATIAEVLFMAISCLLYLHLSFLSYSLSPVVYPTEAKCGM